MTRHLVRTALSATAASLALGLVSVAPAQAATYNHDDATGDVRIANLDASSLTPAADEKAADIEQLRVRHGKHRVIMRLETVDLTRRGSFALGPVFLVRAGDRRYIASATMVRYDGEFVRVARLDRPRASRAIRCRGMFADLDFKGDVAMISVPRRCLGDPRAVTIRAAMTRVTERGDQYYLDSAMDDRRFFPISSTPRIRSAGPRAV